VVCESFETGLLQNDAPQPKNIQESGLSHLPEIQLEKHENMDQRQGRNLEDEHESRLLIKKPPSSKIIRWARSTTERTLRQSWTPSVPKPEHFPKPSFLLPFGRKISRDSQIHRKASTVDIIKPSNIRKRNFGATLADALDKEEEEKIVDLNDIPPPIIKFQGGKSPVPWIDDADNKQPAKKISDIKGERTRGAIVRAIPKQSDIDWERVRVGVKRPAPEPSNSGGSGSSIGQGSDNLERRGRIRIKSSFLGIYQKGQSTTRSPRTEDDVPQRPLKRDRIRNLRIRRPSTSNINSTETTSTTSNIEKPIKTTSISTTVHIPRANAPFSTTTSFSQDPTSENIISLKGMVKEYKEIIRSTIGPSTVTTKITTTVKSTTKTIETSPPKSTSTSTSTVPPTSTKGSTTTATTSTTTTKTTTKTPITTSKSTTTTLRTTKIPSTTMTTATKNTHKTTTSKPTYTDSIPHIDSAENTITTLSSSGLDTSTKSLKQSIRSTTSSTTVSLTVTESKESSGSDIKQSKAHIQKPSLFQLDITTRNPVDVPRPREELKKDLLEAIRRKISRNKASNTGPKFSSSFQITNKTEEPKNSNSRKTYRNTPAYSQSSNLVSSTKPPFFRPIPYSPRKNDAKFGNQSLPKVKIFVNIPDKKKGSVVKIPNVSHIQDKLERLNAAITEGLKLERMREEEEAAIRKDWEGRGDDSDKKPSRSGDTPLSPAIYSLEESTEIITRSPEETYQEKFRKQYSVPKSTVMPKIKVSSVPKMTSPTTTTTVSTTTTKKSTTIRTTTQTTPRTAKPIVTVSTPTDLPTPASKIPRRKKNQKLFSEHPSSHFRPDNWTSNDFIPMPKSNLPPKEDVQLFVVTPKYGMYTPIADRMNNTSNNGTDSESTGRTLGKESKVLEDITGTTVYVIGVIAIIPAAGLLAWFVRMVLRRKELAGSESSSETGLNRPITEDDSLQISGRGGFSLPGHCFETIAEAPENIPKTDNADMLGSVWEFPRSRLRLQTVLGEGNFGKVWKAEADDICGYDGTILVAVKTVKENSAQREVDDLIQEMKIMQEIGPHPNVVTILGVCTDQEPYLLVMEYVMYGKLLTHLREQRMRQSSFFNFSKDGGEVGETLTSKDLNKFAYGVAKGMEFLVSKGIIHRDLAARNILVDHNKNTKISDFGLSRNLRDLGGEMYEQKTKGALPIRWMAPESLYFSVFTPKSDVWGFGILMWEIVTLGSTPYPGMGAREVMRRVRDGYRLERPAHCHPDLYLIIQKCWAGDMNKRPDFSELRKELAKLLEDQHGYIDLQNIPENKYYSMDKNPDEEEKL